MHTGGEENLDKSLRDYEEAARLSTDDDDQRELSRKIHQTKIAIKQAKRKDYYKILSVPNVGR